MEDKYDLSDKFLRHYHLQYSNFQLSKAYRKLNLLLLHRHSNYQQDNELARHILWCNNFQMGKFYLDLELQQHQNRRRNLRHRCFT